MYNNVYDIECTLYNVQFVHCMYMVDMVSWYWILRRFAYVVATGFIDTTCGDLRMSLQLAY